MISVELAKLGTAAVLETAGCIFMARYMTKQTDLYGLSFGVTALILFAYVLSTVDSNALARTYAAYGGIYVIVAATIAALTEGTQLSRLDLAGIGMCLAGAATMLVSAKL